LLGADSWVVFVDPVAVSISVGGFEMKNEVVLYRPNELAEHIEVRFDEDTA